MSEYRKAIKQLKSEGYRYYNWGRGFTLWKMKNADKWAVLYFNVKDKQDGEIDYDV